MEPRSPDDAAVDRRRRRRLDRLGRAARKRSATNLVVGVAVGLAGIAAHAPSGVDWTAFAIGVAGSVPGAVVGARLTGRLDERTLLRAVGVILVGAGVAAIVDGVR